MSLYIPLHRPPLFGLPGCLPPVYIPSPMSNYSCALHGHVWKLSLWSICFFWLFFGTNILSLLDILCHLTPLNNYETSKKSPITIKNAKKKKLFCCSWVETLIKTHRKENNLRSKKIWFDCVPIFYLKIITEIFLFLSSLSWKPEELNCFICHWESWEVNWKSRSTSSSLPAPRIGLLWHSRPWRGKMGDKAVWKRWVG